MVRVLLQGPTKSDNAQALDDVREELLSRSYLENPEGGVVLRHLPVGDPDAPEHVTFYRTETG